MKNFENNQTLSNVIVSELASINCRSKWKKGVIEYAKELAESLTDWDDVPKDAKELRTMLLNGAPDWSTFSYGGCSLAYNGDIAERLATASEIKRCTNKDGLKEYPNPRETWLDVQARALFQASQHIANIFANL